MFVITNGEVLKYRYTSCASVCTLDVSGRTPAFSSGSDGDVHQMVADGVAVLVGVVGAVLLCTGYCTAINWP